METSLETDSDWSKAIHITRDSALESLGRAPSMPRERSLSDRVWSLLDNGYVEFILMALIMPWVAVGSFGCAWWLLREFFPQ